MHIIAQCPRCGYRWWLDAAAADRRLRCRKCFVLLKVPDLTEVADAAERHKPCSERALRRRNRPNLRLTQASDAREQ